MSVRVKQSLQLMVFILFVSLIAVPIGAKERTLEVHFIDVGQGDSSLIHTSDGIDILIDAGQTGQGSKVLKYLEELGVKDLDMVIGSHPHADHIGGLIEVLAGIQVKEVVDPGVIYTTGIFETYLTEIKDYKIRFSTAKRGDTIKVKDLELKVLAPFEDQIRDYENGIDDNVNNVSIVLHLAYGDVSILFTGDSGFDTEDKFIMGNMEGLESTILKVGHHGSRYSTSDMFLSLVSPEVAVIPVGYNSYGHPTSDVLERLNWKEVEIYRADHHGTVVISTQGQGYELRTEKEYEKDDRVNINTAPMGDLADLPGVSYELAREMVEYRESFMMYITIDELLNLELMTPELYEELKPLIKLVD